jgi:hypothetical protein
MPVVMAAEGTTDADVSRTCVKSVLGRMLGPADVGVMNDWRVHKVAGILWVIKKRGARLFYGGKNLT